MSMQVIVFHLLHHLPIFLRRFGPVYSFWMYAFERFNSWIGRRILNRRYPEATVIETYRLSEWANFMELCGHLSEGTIADIQPESNNYDYCPTFLPIIIMSLTEELMDDLRHYYSTTIPEYSELRVQYEREKKQAKVAHRLKQFPEMTEWVPRHSCLLSSQQREMCTGPSTNALFEHTFLSTTTTFAYISWLDGPYLDTDSNLHFTLVSPQGQSLLPVSKLSKPLVTAEDEVGKLDS